MRTEFVVSAVPFTFTADEEDSIRSLCADVDLFLRKKPTGYRAHVARNVHQMIVLVKGALLRAHH